MSDGRLVLLGIVLLKRTTDRHEASRGVSGTAGLSVVSVRHVCYFPLLFCFALFVLDTMVCMVTFGLDGP